VIRAIPVALFLFPVVFAQDKPADRARASDYPSHTSVQGLEIGAEYLVHSVPGDNGYYYADDYLVVEVGVFPTPGKAIRITSGQFALRINQGKNVYTPDSPGTVAASITPRGAGTFPGEQQQQQQPDANGTGQGPPKTIYQTVTAAALPEGSTEKPVKGCLFFRFGRRMKSIRSLELIYDPGEGKPKATIPLI